MTADDKRPPLSDDEGLNHKEWCRENGFSISTGHRIRQSGDGPKFIRVSKRRVIVTRRENRRWQDSRPVTAGA